jgi:hypothetical protein
MNIAHGGAAAPFWAVQVEPFFAIMRRVVLPPRGRAGSIVNQRRARIMQAALHQEKQRRYKVHKTEAERKRCRLCRIKVRLLPEV